MKKKLVVLLMFAGLLLVSSATVAFENEPDGFRGLKWGDAPGEVMVFWGS